jgi:hypothetical protein
LPIPLQRYDIIRIYIIDGTAVEIVLPNGYTIDFLSLMFLIPDINPLG